MSSSEEEDNDPPPVEVQDIGETDENTLRIMLSTDNHLGYCERDPVRGLDSFAAFEEVLCLAREKQCDMVLIAGDLFHDNKPSRRTMHKTMEIIRRYGMGPNPVQIKIVSDQASNFRSIHGTVNYEDEYYSVDLPIFSIHGNHDDPTRDGGTEMLSALDLLSVSNLVNYFGRQDEVDKVEISPVLMEKGSTKVAMYGMGSMRDERLNRMWQGKKVRFLRPEEEEEEQDDEDEEEEGSRGYFNIFALHQNRDLGRGAKNCVHESMIPEWMDLVVWGHEHECRIDPQESVVGTFRITQPGSSVATSLTAGEAIRKHVGILDIRKNQFRLVTIPLTQVRSFVIGEVSLKDHEHALDPEDPKIDTKVTNILNEEVELLVYQAKEKTEELLQDAKACGNTTGDERNPHQLHYRLNKPDEVLVRLKVEHSGFSTLNNQRFGARFVGKVANPSDVLLFHRKRDTTGSSGKRKKTDALKHPMAPQELEEMNIEDLAKQELESSDKKLEILNEQRLGLALDDFVSKEQKQAIADAMLDMLKKQQKKLIRRESDAGTANAVREDAEASREEEAVMEEDEEEQGQTRKRAAPRQRKRKTANDSDDDFEDKENLSEDDMDTSRQTAKKRTKAASSRARSTTSRSKKTATSRSRSAIEYSDEDEDEEIQVAPPSRSRGRPQRRAASSQAKYKVDSDSDNGNDDSDAVIEIQDDDDDSMDDMEVEEPKPKKRGRATASASSARKRAPAARKTPSRQTQLSFTSTSKRGATKSSSSRSTANRRKPVKHTTINLDDDSDEDIGPGLANSLGLKDGWGTANTSSM